MNCTTYEKYEKLHFVWQEFFIGESRYVYVGWEREKDSTFKMVSVWRGNVATLV